VSLASAAPARKGAQMTVQVTASDPTPGSGLKSVVFNYSFVAAGPSGQQQTFTGTLVGTLKAGTTTTWTAPYTPTVIAQYSFTATASDNASNTATSTNVVKIAVQ
jgi:hypothetical protein